jgi:hypothetical protein
MSAAVVVPLVVEGIRDLFSIFGNHQNNTAAKNAAATTARSTNAALEYERAQSALAEEVRQQEAAYAHSRDARADALTDQARADRGPYRAAGQGAVTTLAGLLTPGERVNGASGIQTSADGTQRKLSDLVKERSQVQPLNVPAASAPATPPAVSTVKMVAPDGSTMDLPVDRYQEALSKGAKLAPGAVAPTSATGGVSTVQPVGGVDGRTSLADSSVGGSVPSGSAMTGAMVDPRPGPNTGAYSNRYIKMTNPQTGETRPVLFANVGDLSAQGWVAASGGGK